jgi:hypothetical protein
MLQRLNLPTLPAAAYQLLRNAMQKGVRMSEQPFDPAAQQVSTDHNQDTDTFEAQQGYGVQYEDGKYQNESADDMEGKMRNGSFETNNIANRTASDSYPQASVAGDPSASTWPDADDSMVQPE